MSILSRSGSKYVYEDASLLICPEYGYEFTQSLDTADVEGKLIVKDAYLKECITKV